MFVTRRRLNRTIKAYQSEVKHYRDCFESAARDRDLYKRELESIKQRISSVLPAEVTFTTCTHP